MASPRSASPSSDHSSNENDASDSSFQNSIASPDANCPHLPFTWVKRSEYWEDTPPPGRAYTQEQLRACLVLDVELQRMLMRAILQHHVKACPPGAACLSRRYFDQGSSQRARSCEDLCNVVFPAAVVDAVLGRVDVDDEDQLHRVAYLLYHSYLSVKKQATARAEYQRHAQLRKAASRRSRDEPVDQPLEDMLRGMGINDKVGAVILGKLQENEVQVATLKEELSITNKKIAEVAGNVTGMKEELSITNKKIVEVAGNVTGLTEDTLNSKKALNGKIREVKKLMEKKVSDAKTDLQTHISDNTKAIAKADRKTAKLTARVDGMQGEITEIGKGIKTLLARGE